MANATSGPLAAGNFIKGMRLGLASLYALLLVLILLAVGLATANEAAREPGAGLGAAAPVAEQRGA